MSTPKRQALEQRESNLAARREAIIASARAMAEEDGWDAVTTRLLAKRIDYSQPVLYGHFPGGKAEIMSAVALRGFGDLAVNLRTGLESKSDETRTAAVVTGYLEFARNHPATYEVMFARPISPVFASDDAPEPLRSSFAVITEVFRLRTPPPADIDTAAELLWCSVHGLATLTRDGRLRGGEDDLRVRRLVDVVLAIP